MTINVSEILTKKQYLAFKKLDDKVTNEVLYGGGAGGGKSWLGCFWVVISCLCYPDTRWLIGRSVLKTLKQTTLISLFEVVKLLDIGDLVEYKVQQGEIHFENGSVVILKDLATYPSDPNFESLGSLEITGAFVDECSQISHKARDIVRSRIRYKLDDFDLVPKMLMTCNPTKNWVYTEFYKPYKEGVLSSDKCFIPALVTDNPKISIHYVSSLEKLQESDKQRLLYGNFDYDDDPTALLDFMQISDLWTNVGVRGDRKMVCDIAGQGSDTMILSVWDGFVLIDFKEYSKNSGKDVVTYMNELKEKHNISNRNIIYDSVGMGFAVSGYFRGAYEYNSGARVTRQEYYKLRDDCGYMLSHKIKENEVAINCPMSETTKERIREELGQLKTYQVDKDKKLRILPKEFIKNNLGRSPDWMDVFMMLMVSELDTKKSFYVII